MLSKGFLSCFFLSRFWVVPNRFLFKNQPLKGKDVHGKGRVIFFGKANLQQIDCLYFSTSGVAFLQKCIINMSIIFLFLLLLPLLLQNDYLCKFTLLLLSCFTTTTFCFHYFYRLLHSNPCVRRASLAMRSAPSWRWLRNAFLSAAGRTRMCCFSSTSFF